MNSADCSGRLRSTELYKSVRSTDFDGQEKPVVMVIVTKVPVRQSGVNVGRTENLRFNE